MAYEYDPIGGLNGLFAPAYLAGNQPSMSGSQVSQPNFVTTPGSQIANTDIAGITNQNFQNQMAAVNASNSNFQSLMGGVLGLGAGALRNPTLNLSDRREKTDIRRIGSVLSVGAEGETPKALPIHTFSYKADPASTRHIGPMAQDVEKIDPQAVHTIGRRKFLDTQRVMGNILKAA